jgi:hypothetical protein
VFRLLDRLRHVAGHHLVLEAHQIRQTLALGSNWRSVKPSKLSAQIRSNAQDLWIGVGETREGRTFPNDPVMVIE